MKPVLRNILLQAHNPYYPSNRIKTSKYNIISFVPKCVFLQFTRLVNFYFLFTAIIICIDTISSLDPTTAISPLAFVLLVSLVREAIDEIKRQANDKAVNNQTTLRLTKHQFKEVIWKRVEVGNVLKVQKNQVLPADMVIIKTSEEDGHCFIETSNLDGENNLKEKHQVQALAEVIGDGTGTLQGHIQCEAPNSRIYSFRGVVTLPGKEPQGLHNDQVVLRSTTLRNTDWILGVVVYSGHDTKTMMNKTTMRHKITACEKSLNAFTLYIMCFNVLIMLLLAIMGSLQYEEQHQFHWYIFNPPLPSDSQSILIYGTIRFFSYFILLNTIIPISLLVSLDMAKFFQSIMMAYDNKMNSPQIPFRVQNTLVNEDLGAIQYVFTDKTGTLTDNSMEFRRCGVQSMDFQRGEMENCCCTYVDLDKHLQLNYPDYECQDFIDLFIGILLNNDVLYDPNEPLHSRFSGSSPDEVALVQFAFGINLTFKQKTKNSLILDLYGREVPYDILAVLPFDSDRKRMSVVARNRRTQTIRLFVKGADSQMFKIQEQSEEQQQLYYDFKQRTKEYSTEGLRTLVFGQRTLKENEYTKWKNQMEALKEQRHLRNTEQEEQLLMASLENGVLLVGCTGVEDKLQQGVPETIQRLLDSQIKVVMLTGDKLETAINIGYSCNLLSKDTKILRLKKEVEGEDKAEKERERLQYIEYRMKEIHFRNYEATTSKYNPNVHRRIMKQMDYKESHMSEKSKVMRSQKSYEQYMDSQSNYKINKTYQHYDKFALILEGDRVAYLMTNTTLALMFLKIMEQCRTLIICRATPSQKASIVSFFKKQLRIKSLAIGDGGNDVSMIQAADIGVGIQGKEGTQAVMASDYCFGQFRHLDRLLLVHGRLCLMRTTYFIYYFFYKNFLFTTQQMFFSFQSMFSGQSLWEDGYLMLFNTVTTAMAPLSYAIFEQDLPVYGVLSEKVKGALPGLYAFCRSNKQYSHLMMMRWLMVGLLQALGVFYLTQLLAMDQLLDQTGVVGNMYTFQTCCYVSTVLVSLLTLVIDTKHYTLVELLNYLFLTLMMSPLFLLVWDTISTTMIRHTAQDTYLSMALLLRSALVVSILTLPYYLLSICRFIFSPDLLQRTQQLCINQTPQENKLLKMFSFKKVAPHASENELPNLSQFRLTFGRDK